MNTILVHHFLKKSIFNMAIKCKDKIIEWKGHVFSFARQPQDKYKILTGYLSVMKLWFYFTFLSFQLSKFSAMIDPDYLPWPWRSEVGGAGSRGTCKGFVPCSHQAEHTQIPLGQTERVGDGLQSARQETFLKEELGFFVPACTASQEFLFSQRIFHVNKDTCKLI